MARSIEGRPQQGAGRAGCAAIHRNCLINSVDNGTERPSRKGRPICRTAREKKIIMAWRPQSCPLISANNRSGPPRRRGGAGAGWSWSHTRAAAAFSRVSRVSREQQRVPPPCVLGPVYAQGWTPTVPSSMPSITKLIEYVHNRDGGWAKLTHVRGKLTKSWGLTPLHAHATPTPGPLSWIRACF